MNYTTQVVFILIKLMDFEWFGDVNIIIGRGYSALLMRNAE